MRVTTAAALSAGLMLAAALSGCAAPDGKGELAVDAQLWLCRDESCVGVPAKGAQVEVLVGEEVVRTGALDDTGRLVVRVEPGFYTAHVSVPELGIESPVSQPISVAAGGASEIGMMLPQAEVTPAQSPQS